MDLLPRWTGRLFRSLSACGVVVGLLCFAAALTPTLIPRTALTQGALSGSAFAAGYALGVAGRWLWDFLELPLARLSVRLATSRVAIGGGMVLAAVSLWQAAAWQDSIRATMALAPVDSAHPATVCLVAVVCFLVWLALGRAFAVVLRGVSRRLGAFIPRRVSLVIGTLATVLLFGLLADGILFATALRWADSSFRAYDALIEPDTPQPQDSLKTGSPASAIGWQGLGRAGREFVATGPRAADIGALLGREAREPIRVYAGLGSADSPTERARLALDELQRVGAFERTVLVVVTPTGTGWIDPAAMASVEYLLGGDVASVAVQYSYLSSPLSLLVEPDLGAETAQALFAQVYRYWTTLPRDQRPRLYLHGLSLGALNSEKSAEVFELLADPIHGALWSGPPFAARLWRKVTEQREAGSPAWLPRFRDDALVRFANQHGLTAPPGTPWGPMRIIYLQYASDPVTFFDYRDLYRQPAWLATPRGPDVSPDLRWYPVVTMLQLALDMAVATDTPMGYGHVYAPEHYLDAWLALTDAPGWPPEALARLKYHLRATLSGAPGEPPPAADLFEHRGG